MQLRSGLGVPVIAGLAAAVAINESLESGAIVHVSSGAGLDLAAVRAVLSAECAVETLTHDAAQYWGVDCEGDAWRIHVEIEALS